MKNITSKIIKVTLAMVAVMFIDGCTDLTDHLSTDPVNITNGAVVPVPQYISGIETSLIGAYEGDVTRIGAMWAGYFDGEDRQYAGLQTYNTSGQDYDNEWVTIYTGIMNNTKIVKQKARAVNNNKAVAVVQLIEAMSIGLAADLWGDVPFVERAQYPKITTPKFDTQGSVYAAAQTLLDSAILNIAKVGSVSGDFLFPDLVGTAHTLKARYYLHVRDYPKAMAEASLGLNSASKNVMAPHGDAYGQTFNLYYSFLTYDRPGYMAADASYAPTLLDPNEPNYRGNAKTNENGRFNYMYAPFSYWAGLNTAAKYDPNVLVDFDWGVPTIYNGYFGATTSFPIVTFEENQLILAEAHAKIGNAQLALDALNTLRGYYSTGGQFGASTAYFTDDPDLSGAQYDDYLLADFAPGGMENADNIDANAALLREILEERYITLTGQLEGFNDMRRTNNYLKIPIAAGKTDFPRRFLYSQIEVNTNPNVPTASVGLFDPVASFKTAY